MRHILKVTFLLSFLVVAGVGCIQFSNSNKEADGGVWKTTDLGEKWGMKKVLFAGGGLKSIGSANIVEMEVDPNDPAAIYVATAEDGLLYSYDGGDAWFQAKQLSSGKISSVMVDAKNKCTIYATMGPRVWKSTDCNRTYNAIYFESRGDVALTQIVADWYSPNNLYAGTSAGDLLKSTDAGANWAPIQRFEDRIVKIYIDPFDSRTVYVGLKDRGIWKTSDGGANWASLAEGLKDLEGARGLVTMVGDAVTHNTILIATKYGILRTTDGGTTWQALNLPTPPGSVTIYSLAVNPRTANEIYYGTASTFYRSSNGGSNWTTKKLPTGRAATALMVDTSDGKVIYLGATLFKK